jgi:GMP synthase-like glutamine amidotransferase
MIESEQDEYTRSLSSTGAELVFKNTLDESLPWKNPQELLDGALGVIFGGSGEFDFDGGRGDDDPARLTAHAIRDRVKMFIEYLFTNNIPTLGICFGHQIIGELRDAKVVNDTAQKKVGTHNVILNEEGKQDPLLKDAPGSFDAQYGHKDSLSSLPVGGVVLASADNCTYSIVRYSDKIYTLQFHPELNAQDVVRKLANSPGYLPEGVAPESIIRESKDASAILPRFVGSIV